MPIEVFAMVNALFLGAPPVLVPDDPYKTGGPKAVRRVLGYLLFSGDYSDDWCRHIKLSAKLLGAMEGRRHDQNGYSTAPLIRRCQEVLGAVLWPSTTETETFPDNYRADTGLARTVPTPALVKTLDELLRRHRLSPDYVNFTTGRRVKDPHESERFYADQQDIVDEIHATKPPPPSLPLLRLLHSLPHELFSISAERIEQVETVLDEMETQAESDEHVAAHIAYTRAIIRGLTTATPHRPIYRPVEKTPRIYSGHPLYRAPSWARSILLSDTVGVDVAATQLNLIAGVGESDDLNQFLKTGESFWAVMDEYMDGEVPKEHLKTATYHLCFGGSEGGLYKSKKIKGLDGSDRMTTPPLTERQAKQFLAHWIVQELLKTRAKLFKRLKTTGITDAFGKKMKADTLPECRSVTACIIQSWELKVMLAVRPVMRRYADIAHIRLFLHDGLYVGFDPEATEAERGEVIDDLKAAVSQGAGVLGFPHVRLEVKD